MTQRNIEGQFIQVYYITANNHMEILKRGIDTTVKLLEEKNTYTVWEPAILEVNGKVLVLRQRGCAQSYVCYRPNVKGEIKQLRDKVDSVVAFIGLSTFYPSDSC